MILIIQGPQNCAPNLGNSPKEVSQAADADLSEFWGLGFRECMVCVWDLGCRGSGFRVFKVFTLNPKP